jgi:hypothetical protein
VRLAYADPPYIGQAKRHYSADERCAEVNHGLLISYLREFDGWALSASSTSIHLIAPMCPEARIGAYCKTWIWLGSRGVQYSWEPVFFVPARAHRSARDTVTERPPSMKDLIGKKGPVFCNWLFEILGADRDDEFVDVFPGSGGVGRAWEHWCAQTKICV